MTSQIHDGLYFANLVFLVGVAAGAVTIVFPAYVYHHKAMHEVTVLGEMLAISAVCHGHAVRVCPHGATRPALAHAAVCRHLQHAGLHAGVGRAGAQRLPDAQLSPAGSTTSMRSTPAPR
jgi:hypothetical protein